MSRFDDAISKIDAENAQDPAAKELVYSERMTRTLERIAPGADEAVQLAVRAQHIRRFDVPRSDYPDGRKGYHRWRADLAKRHADLTTEILESVGYEQEIVERVRSMLLKRGLKSDDDVQLLEDVACVVFLEHYFAEFAREHDDDKLVDILKKTWAKMSARGHEAALALELGERERRLVQRALAG